MNSLSDLIPIPPKENRNTGLSSAREDTILKKFGKPGALTKKCSSVTGKIKKRMVSGVQVAPNIKVSGLDFAVESLRQIFAEAENTMPDVFKEIKTAGMLCVRARKPNPAKFSNHSFGTAIDLFFGTAVVPQGKPMAHRGLVTIFPIFNKHGWYWGAEFSGDSVDSMHFELAQETILKMPD